MGAFILYSYCVLLRALKYRLGICPREADMAIGTVKAIAWPALFKEKLSSSVRSLLLSGGAMQRIAEHIETLELCFDQFHEVS